MPMLAAAFALVLAVITGGASGDTGLAVGLSVAPWSGAGLTGAVPARDAFRVTISGAPGGRVHVAASGLPAGWIGSWCTDRVCAPFRTTLDLPASGTARVEFQIIPPDDAAAHRHPSAQLRATDGRTSATAVARVVR